MCTYMLPLKTRPGSDIWMPLFVLSSGTSLETFMSCQVLIIHLDGTASFWICTSCLLIVISNKTSRAETCLEFRGDKQLSSSLKIILSANNWL